jgi:hypothetical protein
MYGLRQFEFKAWIMSSASVFHKTLCRRAARIECLIPVVVVSARYTLCPVRTWMRPDARLRDSPSTEFLIRISCIGHVQPKTSIPADTILRAQLAASWRRSVTASYRGRKCKGLIPVAGAFLSRLSE